MEIEDEIKIERFVNNSKMVRFGNEGDFFLDDGDRGSSNNDKSRSVNGEMSASADSSRGDFSGFSVPKYSSFDDENPAQDGQSDAGLSYDQSKAAYSRGGLSGFSDESELESANNGAFENQENDTASKGGDYSQGDLSGFTELDKNRTTKKHGSSIGWSQAGSNDNQSLGGFSGLSWFRRGAEDKAVAIEEESSFERKSEKESGIHSSSLASTTDKSSSNPTDSSDSKESQEEGDKKC